MYDKPTMVVVLEENAFKKPFCQFLANKNIKQLTKLIVIQSALMKKIILFGFSLFKIKTENGRNFAFQTFPDRGQNVIFYRHTQTDRAPDIGQILQLN